MGKSVWPEAMALIGTAGFTALAIRGWPSVDDAITQQVWAAWAQALGSVIAVVAAFLVGRQQAQSTLRAVERTHELGVLAKRSAISSVVDVVHMRVEEICAVLGPNISDRVDLWKVYHPDIVESMKTALRDLPVYELASSQAIDGLLRFREQLVFFGQSVKKYYDGFHVDPLFMESFDQLKGADYRQQQEKLVKGWHEVSVRNIEDQRAYLRGHYDMFKSALNAG